MTTAGRWEIVTPRRVPLRQVWKHEQYDFSEWVRSNTEFLSEHLGITLEADSLDPEVAVGAFSADLVGTGTDDRTGEQVKVVIENQLERTDHDHLGKVLTYCAHHDADYAVWIAGEVRSEHVRAVTWLNEHSELTVWLFQVDAVAVNDTQVAPLLRRVVGPTMLSRQARAENKAMDEDAHAQLGFWTEVLDRAKPKFADLQMFGRHQPRKGVHMWNSVPGVEGDIGWQMWVTATGSWACLKINGVQGQEEAQHYYDQLVAHREEIETSFPGELQWLERADVANRQLRWDNPVAGGYRSDPETWPAAADSLVDGMRALVDATHPYARGLAPYLADEEEQRT